MPSEKSTHVPSTDWADDFTLEKMEWKLENNADRRRCLLNVWATFYSGAEQVTNGGPLPPLPPMVLQMLNEASEAMCWLLQIDESTGRPEIDKKTGRAVSLVGVRTPLKMHPDREWFDRPLTELQHPNWWRSFVVKGDPDPTWLASLGLRMRYLRAVRTFDSTRLVPIASVFYLNAKTLVELDLSVTSTDGRLEGLERFPTLRKLYLRSCCEVESVTCLGASRSLVDLDLTQSNVTSRGIEGLERIPTLTRLNLFGCRQITSVACLGASTSLAFLCLTYASGIVSEGLEGLERIPTLTTLVLAACYGVTSVACLGASRSIVDLDLCESNVTSEGIEGLERIPTLTHLNLRSCSAITSVSCLAESTSLVELRLDATSVTLDGLWCLGRIPTLAQLHLEHCKWIKRRPSLATLRKKAAAAAAQESPARRHRTE